MRRERSRGRGTCASAAALSTTLLIAVFLVGTARASELLITDVTLIDGAGSPPVPNSRLLIRDGKIAAIGEAARSESAQRIDGRGGYILPGLIDAHTHLASVPGSMYRKDSP
ncbi:MAG: hydrolase, partial [bacterium]|nr:hydrolase [bacterium]